MQRNAVVRRIALTGAVACLLSAGGSLTAGPERRPDVARPGAPRGGVAERIRRGGFPEARGTNVARRDDPESEARARDVATRLRAAVAEARSDRRSGERGAGAVAPAPRRATGGIETSGRNAAGETIEIGRAPGVGTPRLLRGRRLHRATGAGGTRVERDTATAREFLRAHRDVLRIADPDAEWRVERTEVDALGCCQVRLAQTWRGLDVWPARIVVQVREDGDVDSLSGAFVPTPRRLVTRPTLGAADAAEIARAAVPGGKGVVETDPVLIVHAGRPEGGRVPRLAWKTEVAASAVSHWLVVVDAHTGAVLRKFDRVAHQDTAGSGTDTLGQTRQIRVWNENGTYFLVDTSKPMFVPASNPPDDGEGVIVILDSRNDEADPFPPDLFHVTSLNPASWPLRDSVSASFGLSETYDYFFTRHARNSIDGEGGSLFGTVRVGTGFRNAFWFNGLMAFGDGDRYAASLDVVGHEMSHGVTEKTAALVYQDQSGALNEAMSDVFGEMVESRTTGGGHDWVVGTQLVNPLRDMEDPSRFEIVPGLPFPTRMSEFIQTTEDNGGVHLNSSIINRAYYLLAEGLPNAVGTADAERIFYRTLTTKLVAQSRFIDCRLGAIASAQEIFGAGSAQATAVADAFDGVEIFGAAPTPPPPQAPPVVGDDATICAYFDLTAVDFLLARREDDLGDPAQGTTLVQSPVNLSRPSVTGDGTVAVYVDASADLCVVPTDASGIPECLGSPGLVHSVALSPDATKIAFVLRDAAGDPVPSITVVDDTAGTTRTYPLTAPILDGGTIDVLSADAMDFSRDGSFLLYDAFNVLRFPDGEVAGVWSIYGLDLATETTYLVVEPVEGLDIGNPSFAQTSDRWITFEGYDAVADETTVFTRDLFSGETVAVVRVPSPELLAAPSFTGDDRAVIVTAPDATNTGSSLFRQDLLADHMTPTGDPTLWLEDGALGVIYRRGAMQEPPPPESVEVTLATGAPRIDTLDLDVTLGGTPVEIRLQLAHAGNGAFAAGGPCTVGGDDVTVSGKLVFKSSTGAASAALTLKSPIAGRTVKLTANLATGLAKVDFRGPEGRGKGTVPFAATGAEPTSRITLRPTVDFRGRIGGTASVLGGFGNDLDGVASLSGKVRRGKLTLKIVDGVAKRKLEFQGTLAGDEYLGKLVYKLPPVTGTAKGFAVPSVFGE